nr:hypothetical protein [uncultured Psychrobacter sp.]
MTTQSDIKKLAEQMAGSMNSFDDTKDFQKQLIRLHNHLLMVA